MADLIDRKEALDAIEYFTALDKDLMYAVIDSVEKIPSVDAVPVVRCKDCRKCVKQRTKRNGNLMYFCTIIGGKIDAEYQVNPNHYCSHGEPVKKPVECVDK